MGRDGPDRKLRTRGNDRIIKETQQTIQKISADIAERLRVSPSNLETLAELLAELYLNKDKLTATMALGLLIKSVIVGAADYQGGAIVKREEP